MKEQDFTVQITQAANKFSEWLFDAIRDEKYRLAKFRKSRILVSVSISPDCYNLLSIAAGDDVVEIYGVLLDIDDKLKSNLEIRFEYAKMSKKARRKLKFEPD